MHNTWVLQMHWVKHITHTCMLAHTTYTHILINVMLGKGEFWCWSEGSGWLRESKKKNVHHMTYCWQLESTVYSCLWKIKACRFWVNLKGRHGQQMLLHQNNTEYISDSEHSTRLQGTVVKPTYISEGRAILRSWDYCQDITEYISEQRTKLLSQHSHRVHFRM